MRVVDGDLIVEDLKKQICHMHISDKSSLGKCLAIMAEREMAMIIITDILRGKFDVNE